MLVFCRPSPHVFGFLLALGCIFLCLLDVRHWGRRDPGSAFFDPDFAFQPSYSLVRKEQAAAFIEKADNATNLGEFPKAKQGHRLCVGIAAKQRKGVRYFRDTVGSLLEGLTEAEREDISLVSFIANVDPKEHAAYRERWLRTLSNRVLTYDDIADHGMVKAIKANTTVEHRFKRKPLFDYATLLDACYADGAPYVLMIEDDTLAAEGWYAKTTQALDHLERKKAKTRTIYLRLFYNERLLGWNLEQWPTTLVTWTLVEAAMGVVLFGAARLVPCTSSILTRWTILAILLFFNPLCTILFFLGGRLTLAGPPNGLHRMDTYGCCSQALLFQRTRIPELIDYYRSQNSGYVDVLTERYAEQHNLARWALTPGVFQHVGTISSKASAPSRWGRKNTENIWNFSFEMFHAEESRPSHIRQA